MNLPVFLIINARSNPNNIEAKANYLKKSKPITAKYGAIPVASYALNEALDDNEHPEVCAIISFPSKASILALFKDDDYQNIVKERDLGFSSIRYFIGNEQIA